MAEIHTGSWGTPELGITEAIGSLFGAGRTAQGGSNLTSSVGTYPTAQVSSPTGYQSLQGPGLGWGGTTDVYSPAKANTVSLQGTPDVLGANTGGGSGGGTPQPQQQTIDKGNLTQFFPGYSGWNLDAAWQDYLSTGGSGKGGSTGGDPYASLRGEIGSAWDQYIASLGGQEQGLLQSKTAQEQIAESQARQGLGTLNTQKQEGLGQLGAERGRIESGQTKTLRDLSSNLRNAFMAGNVYLGARGAGDSSAANQYALALTKEGSRQRGDVMAQTSDQLMEVGRREQDLISRVQQEERNIEETKGQQIASIASWFAQAQNQIRQAQAQGQLNKAQDIQGLSRDILNRALSAMDQINQEAVSRRQGLESWAISNSQSLNQLKQNLAGVSQFTANIPQAQQIFGTPTVNSSGNINTPIFGYGSTSDERRLQGRV